MIQVMKNLNLLQKKWYVIDSQTAKGNTGKVILIYLKQKALNQVWCIYFSYRKYKRSCKQWYRCCVNKHLIHAKQKLMMCLLTKQIIFTLQCQCTIWLNMVIISWIHLEGYDRLKEMKFLLIMLIWALTILNRLNKKQLLWEKHKIII